MPVPARPHRADLHRRVSDLRAMGLFVCLALAVATTLAFNAAAAAFGSGCCTTSRC